MGVRFFFKFVVGMISLSLSTLNALDKSSFYELHRQPIYQWIGEQIQNDLTPFDKEFRRTSLDEIFATQGESLCLTRVQISQGQITIQKSECAQRHIIPNEIIPHLFALNELIPLPDIDFLFTSFDYLSREMSWPIFVLSKQKEAKGILFPDWFALNDFEPDKSQILIGNKTYPWEVKKNCLFFRGMDSGVFDLTKWWEYPRAKLIALSLQYPSLIDARFSFTLHNRIMLDAAISKGFMGNWVYMNDHPSSKYLMDIDGNCAATPRFPLYLFSNSVILKNMTNSVLWFYKSIKPHTHFIPVEEDLSDLFVQLEWAKNNDDKCREISKNATELAEKNLTQEVAYLYLYHLLKEYSIKQRSQYNLQ